MKRLALALGIFLALCTVGWSQSAVQIWPLPGTTVGGNASTTITSSSAFQLLFAAGAPSPENHNAISTRHGCIIENNAASTDNMWISEGATAATATKATSFVLVPGGVFNCNQFGVVLTGEIDVTGTATQPFYAVQF